MQLLEIEEGHFVFESGHHGTLWMDLEALFLRPGVIDELAAQLAGQLRPVDADVVCGPLVEGAFLALLVSRLLQLPFTYSERRERSGSGDLYPYDYRLPRTLRPHVRGKRVLIVNDVISAGSAVRGTAADVERVGGTVAGIAALLVLGDWTARFAAEKGIAFTALATETNELWPPSACPLCERGMPLERRIQSV